MSLKPIYQFETLLPINRPYYAAEKERYFKIFMVRAGELGLKEEYESSLKYFEEALKIYPGHANALLGKAVVLAKRGLFEEAFEAIDKIPESAPQYFKALVFKGDYFSRGGRWTEALRHYDLALKINKDDPTARICRGVLLLRKGIFEEGFRELEARWDFIERKNTKVVTKAPQLTRGEPVKGKIILVIQDQGYGDTIHFSRYADFLTQMGASVILIVPDRLINIMKTLPCRPEVINIDSETKLTLPLHHLQCSFPSLPFALNATFDTIPSTPYLSAPLINVEQWNKRLGASEKKRIGIVWRGRKKFSSPDLRHLSLEFPPPAV